jgi:hypothetical protein
MCIYLLEKFREKAFSVCTVWNNLKRSLVFIYFLEKYTAEDMLLTIFWKNLQNKFNVYLFTGGI